MLAALTIRVLGLYIPLAVLAFMVIHVGLFRYRVRRIFGPEQPYIAALEPVWRRLDEINADIPSHVFGALRITTVALGGRNILLVYGLVAFNEALRGNTVKRVYTIADGDEIDWMRHFPDVFELALSTADSAVFWVRLPALIRLTR